jgi:hypothetical protein
MHRAAVLRCIAQRSSEHAYVATFGLTFFEVNFLYFFGTFRAQA